MFTSKFPAQVGAFWKELSSLPSVVAFGPIDSWMAHLDAKYFPSSASSLPCPALSGNSCTLGGPHVTTCHGVHAEHRSQHG